MAVNNYKMFKGIKPRIRRYERKENELNIVISEFSCSTEHRDLLEEFLKKIRQEGWKTEIVEVNSITICFRIQTSQDFFEELIDKTFKVF